MGRSTHKVYEDKKGRAVDMVVAGSNRKEIASELGVSSSHAHKILRDAGIYKIDLTEAERAFIAASRRGENKLG